MKLRSLQGHFGNMNGRKIEFADGFSHLVLPNGWGKSTLCAFLRVMLYGLNTARRDTQQALSDKTRYVPQDGHAMSGRLEIEWNGRAVTIVRQLYGLNTARRDTQQALSDKTRYVPQDGHAMSGRLEIEWNGRAVTIVRQTGKGGPMQDFDAFYTDNGEKCRLLTAKNCGQVLLGMGEDAFLSSMMVDGEDVNRPSEELQELLSSMAQTGDATGSAAKALARLDRWRLDIRAGRGHGEHDGGRRGHEPSIGGIAGAAQFDGTDWRRDRKRSQSAGAIGSLAVGYSLGTGTRRAA